MKYISLNNLKKAAAFSTLGLAFLFGTSEVSNAQSRKSIQRQERKIEKEREKLERKRDRYEDKIERREQSNRWRVYNNGRYYQTDNRGADLLRQAVNQGYQQGYRQGQIDRQQRRNDNYYGSSVYRSGNYGYQSYVDSGQYRYYFQQGFERGYQDGYNTTNRYGTYRNGFASILSSVLGGILNLQQY